MTLTLYTGNKFKISVKLLPWHSNPLDPSEVVRAALITPSKDQLLIGPVPLTYQNTADVWTGELSEAQTRTLLTNPLNLSSPPLYRRALLEVDVASSGHTEHHKVTIDASLIGSSAPDVDPPAPIGYVAATDISALRVVRLNAAGQLIYADIRDGTELYSVVGLTLYSISLGSTGNAVNDMEVEDSSWNWDLSLPIWLAQEGRLTQTEASDVAWLNVAFPITPTRIRFELQELIIIEGS